MKFSFEVGEVGKHRVDFSWNQLNGVLEIKVDGEVVQNTGNPHLLTRKLGSLNPNKLSALHLKLKSQVIPNPKKQLLKEY